MNTSEATSILLVDDEQAVLDGLCRQHRKHFSLVPACGPEAGLKMVSQQGPFAVVVSDYQMPGMNGAAFLAKVRELSPSTVRVMLTGQADFTTATDAVNRGNIFRFLSKPCDTELFRSVVEAGIEQFRLVNAEKMLLEHTVRGSIEVLADVMALSNPAAFGRATRIRHYVRHVVKALGLPNGWRYETAAMLSQIGCVAVPNDVFDRLGRGEELPPEQALMMEKHPELARDLLAKIPRLQKVAQMVYHQNGRIPDTGVDDDVRLGSLILAASLDFEELVSLGANPQQALTALQKNEKRYGAKILAALATSTAHQNVSAASIVGLQDLEPGMSLLEEIRNGQGMLIVPAGHELTKSSLQRLRNHAGIGQLKKTQFRVSMANLDSAQGGATAA